MSDDLWSCWRMIAVFTYNKQFHNVLAVSKADYKNCDATKPTATWSTGNDSVVLNTTGHHYFLCGFTGHCAAGQKVDIRVAASSAAPSASPTAAPSPTPSGSKPSGGATAAPSPHPNAAPKALSASSLAATVAASLLSLAAAVLAWSGSCGVCRLGDVAFVNCEGPYRVCGRMSI